MTDTVDFRRAASPKIWAELEAANARIAELTAALIRAEAIIGYLERGADVVSSDRVADDVQLVRASLATPSVLP